MSGGLDPEARKALSKVGGIDLCKYALLYTFILLLCWSFFDTIEISRTLLWTLIILLNLPGLMLVIIHIYLISISFGIGSRIIKDKTLSRSALNLLGGAILVLATAVLLIVLFGYLDWDHYEWIIESVPYIYLGVCAVYLIVYKKALALIWIWVTEYTQKHLGEAGAFNLLKEHPKSKLIGLAFKAVFSEGEMRTQAVAKLAFLATYKLSPEEDKGEKQTKDLAKRLAPEKMWKTCPVCGTNAPRLATRCPTCEEPFSNPP